jgi:hypothetical protein
MTAAEIQKELALHDEALFGIWISASQRSMGLVEKTNTILKRLTLIEKLMKVIAVISFFPLLRSVGIPTESIVPFVLKTVLHLSFP